MPVIRGQIGTTALDSRRREELLTAILRELREQGVAGGPVIFEIPLEQSNKLDVLVVWENFRGLRSEDRTGLILDAYADRSENIAQALGVTYDEAIDQNLLPYSVVPMARLGDANPSGGIHGAFPRIEPTAQAGEADPEELRSAMINQGGIVLPAGKVVLRLPTMAMAEDAHRRLCDILPRGYWSIVQTTVVGAF